MKCPYCKEKVNFECRKDNHDFYFSDEVNISYWFLDIKTNNNNEYEFYSATDCGSWLKDKKSNNYIIYQLKTYYQPTPKSVKLIQRYINLRAFL